MAVPSPTEGYVLASYGSEAYLRHAVASAQTIRRHDQRRPIALWCSDEHARLLAEAGLTDLFVHVEPLPPVHQSIVGVKHHVHRFVPFDRTLYADSDIVWCRNPDALWQQLAAYPFTTMGDAQADMWFGAAKNYRVAADVLLNRRARTLRRLGLTYLPRVLSALMYVSDRDRAREVCESAQRYVGLQHLTHFQSRLRESGRALESCEWSLALAMSAGGVPVFPWFRGVDSVIVDYFPHTTEHDEDFHTVHYRLWTDRKVYEMQALPRLARRSLTAAATRLPHRSEYVVLTPPALHFGRLPFKQPFYAFADRVWEAARSGAARR
jgi:hypothetical protein